ncbi:MAG: serine/threonine protein kinase [Labilithrix sp.]|nr:serine/threonine protein kinase [Labilithrix sp.]
MVGLALKDKGNAAPPIVPGLKIKGDTIAGRYRVERLIGAGSSGFVVAARHVYLRRRVTLKILTSTTAAHQRAQRRHLALAHQAAALRGPHVAHIVDTGFTEEGIPFIATERLEGRTLAEELSTRTQLPPVEAVRWILQACEGLAEAHSAGIVHGDLKPQNLFLAGDANASSTDHGGESRVLKVLDFGMATPVDAEGDEGTAAWFASPAYLAPEQIRDPSAVDVRIDVWALGVILYELIAGSLPFESDTVSGMLVAVSYDEPAMLTAQDVPFELARLVQSCLSKPPSGRPADVATLALALAPFAGAEGIALARRVESALSSPPPMAVTLDADAETPDAAAKTDDAAPVAAASSLGSSKTAQRRGKPLGPPRPPSEAGSRTAPLPLRDRCAGCSDTFSVLHQTRPSAAASWGRSRRSARPPSSRSRACSPPLPRRRPRRRPAPPPSNGRSRRMGSRSHGAPNRPRRSPSFHPRSGSKMRPRGPRRHRRRHPRPPRLLRRRAPRSGQRSSAHSITAYRREPQKTFR